MGIVAEDKPGLHDNAHSSLMTAVAVRSQRCSKYAAFTVNGLAEATGGPPDEYIGCGRKDDVTGGKHCTVTGEETLETLC